MNWNIVSPQKVLSAFRQALLMKRNGQSVIGVKLEIPTKGTISFSSRFSRIGWLLRAGSRRSPGDTLNDCC